MTPAEVPREKVVPFMLGIATAEGFGISGALPTRANNPGDLCAGDVGHGTDQGKTIYGSMEEGWAALEHEVRLILSGNSPVYGKGLTFQSIAEKYTGGDNAAAWAVVVASQCGMEPEDTIADYLVNLPLD